MERFATAQVDRALVPALENWVVKNTAPPPSRYPTVAASDPRATLAQLYAGKADYLAKFGAVTDALVAASSMTPLDATAFKANAANVSPVSITAP